MRHPHCGGIFVSGTDHIPAIHTIHNNSTQTHIGQFCCGDHCSCFQSDFVFLYLTNFFFGLSLLSLVWSDADCLSTTWWSWWKMLLSVLYGISTGLLLPLTPSQFQLSASFSAVSSQVWFSCWCTTPFFIPMGRALDGRRVASVLTWTPLLSSLLYHLKELPILCVPTEELLQPWSVKWGSILIGTGACQCFKSDPLCHPRHRHGPHALRRLSSRLTFAGTTTQPGSDMSLTAVYVRQSWQ